MKAMKKMTILLAVTLAISQFQGVHDITTATAAIVPNSNGQMSWEMPKSEAAFDISGKVNNISKQTTYASRGYSAVLSVGASTSTNERTFTGLSSGVPVQHPDDPDVWLTITADHKEWTNPATSKTIPYVEIVYEVENRSTAAYKTVHLAGHADIQIGVDDFAPLEKILASDGTREGLHMTEVGRGSSSSRVPVLTDRGAFTFICGGNYFNDPIAEAVDTLWIGQYGSRTQNKWVDSSVSRIPANPLQDDTCSTDTGMAYSWQNRTVASSSSLMLEVYFSVTDEVDALLHTVTYDLNFAPGTPPPRQTIVSGELATQPTDDGSWTVPTGFAGWYTDPACTTLFNFSTPIDRNMVLYAKWADDPPYHISYYVVNGIGGTISATVDGANISSGTQVAPLKTITFTATPASGYLIKAWMDNNVLQSDTSAQYTIPNINSLNRSRVVTVEFISASENSAVSGEIDYVDSNPAVIVPSDNYGFTIDLTSETFNIPPATSPDYLEIRSYSLNGGLTWRNLKGSVDSVLGPKKMPKLLDKGLTLWLSDERLNPATKHPDNSYTGGNPRIAKFPVIYPRPKAPKVVVNYAAGNSADASANTPGKWALTESSVLYAMPLSAVKFYDKFHILQIGTPTPKKTSMLDSKGWGKFPIKDGTSRTDGISIKPFTGPKEQKYYYLVRTAPTEHSDNTYTPASKQKRFTVLGERKPLKYKIKTKKNAIQIGRGTSFTRTDSSGNISEVSISATSLIEIVPGTTVSLWKAATTKKPASKKQTVT